MEQIATESPKAGEVKRLGFFERYLTLWVALCMVMGVAGGKLFPSAVRVLRGLEFGQGSQINVPIAGLIWLMIIPMMMKVGGHPSRQLRETASCLHAAAYSTGPDDTKQVNLISLRSGVRRFVSAHLLPVRARRGSRRISTLQAEARLKPAPRNRQSEQYWS